MKTIILTGLAFIALISFRCAAADANGYNHAYFSSTNQTQMSVDYQAQNESDGSSAWVNNVWFNVTLPAGSCNGLVTGKLISYWAGGLPPGSQELNFQMDPNNSCHYSASLPKLGFANDAGIITFGLAVKVGNIYLTDPTRVNMGETESHNFQFRIHAEFINHG